VEYVSDHDLELDTYASAEAQVAAISDDIAYNSHDIDDGLRADTGSNEFLSDPHGVDSFTSGNCGSEFSKLGHVILLRQLRRISKCEDHQIPVVHKSIPIIYIGGVLSDVDEVDLPVVTRQ